MFDCPVNDWLCPYFDNDGCTLETAKEDCDAWFGLDDEEDE